MCDIGLINGRLEGFLLKVPGDLEVNFPLTSIPPTQTTTTTKKRKEKLDEQTSRYRLPLHIPFSQHREEEGERVCDGHRETQF
jgi:hypothetical protein